jgi:hypothetical protein
VAEILSLLGIVAEVALVCVLLWRRTLKTLPVFTAYVIWGSISDVLVVALRYLGNPHGLHVWVVDTVVDSLFQYCVLIELAWSIVRPLQRSLPRGFLAGISTLIAAVALLAWPFSAVQSSPAYPRELLLACQFQRSFAVVRIVFFLLLAASSQLLRIGWRDRELQIASGLGFYSLVSLAGSMLHSHQAFALHYYYVDVAIGWSYLLSLSFWIFSFAHQEAPRQEMTDEMQRIIIGVAGTMHRQLDKLRAANS